MKAKTSVAFFVALLVLATQFSLRAQTDCYSIQCPSKIFAPCEGVYGARAWFSVAAANTCNPSSPPTITYSSPPGSVFPPGTNVVCATIQIPGLAPRQCCFEVIVDRCCPTNCIDILCPSNIVVACQQTGGTPGAFVNLPPPRATNNCGDHVLPSGLQYRCTPQAQPGQPVFFPPGTNEVVCCVSDSQGLLKCCCFEVIVKDCPVITSECRPTITCPPAAEIQVSCQSPSGAVVFFPPPKVTDPCGQVVSVSCTHPSGSVFPNGKTTVGCCLTYGDAASGLLTECCCFDVVVRCCRPTNCVSRLDCPTNVVVDCPPATGIVLTYTVAGGNNCEPTSISCNPPSGSIIYGSTNVCCKLLSSSGVSLADCCFPVLVGDTTPPVLHCPTNITVVSSNCQPVAVSLSIDASDNCDPKPTVTCTPPGNTFPCGVTTVNCIAVDASGNKTDCTFTVTVICDSNPQIVCPPDMFFRCTPAAGVVVNYTVTVTNGCPGTAVSCHPPSGSLFPPGTTTVCCFINPTAPGCCFKVTVTPDDIPPNITCPSNIVVISPNCTPLDVTYGVTASDNCQLDSVTCRPPSGSLFPLGVTAVTCCAVDKVGNSNCCTFFVTVRCPSNCIQVICPSNIVVNCAGPNGAVATYSAYAIDTCNNTELALICTPPSGSLFPLGVTRVCCTNTTAAAGAVNYCCFTVTVRPDTTPPTILCPSNIVVSSADCKPIDVFYHPPTASDDCQLDSVNCQPPSGSVFPVGFTTVTCCAVDKAGNSNCCTFTITVRCPTNCIQVICPSNIVVNCAGPDGAVVTYSAYAIDTCNNTELALTCTPPSGSVFPLGVTRVCCTNATAAGAVNYCCFTVTVRPDTIPPIIVCPSNLVVSSPNCTPIDVFYHPPTASDDCQLDSVNCTPPSGSVFPIGVTTVTCCAVDKAGNSACCTFTISVRCPTNCVQLICPSNIVVNCAGPNGAVVTYAAYVIDTCTGSQLALTCTPPSGSLFPLGVTTVCCTNTTAVAGAVKYCCFTVTVRPDTTPPTILCPSNIVVSSPNCTPIDVFYHPPTASDDCQLDSVDCKPPSGSVFPVGITTVTCCAVDKAGNSNCCNFTITVRCPTNCIEVVCPSNIVVNCAGPNGAVVSYKPYATNICTGVELPMTCSPPSGSTFPIGVTQVCCTNAVSGTVGTGSVCCFTVTVRPDTTPPTILCPSNIVVSSPNCTPIDVLYPAPTATDNCQLDSVNCTPPTTFVFPPGVTTVTCCAVDKAGNSNCCNFTVTVRCPTNCIRVVCPTNVVVDCAGPNGAPVVYNAYAIDTCTGAIFPVTCTRPSGSVFPIGVTVVCCTNSVSGAVPLWCCFDVTVKRDVLPPVINCPSNIYVLCAKPNGVKVTYSVTATDNCDPAVAITCVPPSGSLFPIGCTNVTCTAADNAGNASTCTFKVCVLAQGCYLRNPSFELLSAPLPAPNACGDPIALALGWSALAGTPDLFRPPFASVAPGNCRGREKPCEGTNYAGLEGGYTSSGGFLTEEMMGTLIAPLSNGQKFRLRACLSLAESSPGPVLIEFVLANSANLAQQQVIHQVMVTQVVGWQQYLPPCFTVPTFGTWDRLIIRAAQVIPGQHTYQLGYVYVDNVNICCCKPVLHVPVLTANTVTVTWDGTAQLQGASALGDPTDWQDITTPVEVDPETGDYRTTMLRSRGHVFFRLVASDGTVECIPCGGGE